MLKFPGPWQAKDGQWILPGPLGQVPSRGVTEGGRPWPPAGAAAGGDEPPDAAHAAYVIVRWIDSHFVLLSLTAFRIPY
jgi:hypothetical protein